MFWRLLCLQQDFFWVLLCSIWLLRGLRSLLQLTLSLAVHFLLCFNLLRGGNRVFLRTAFGLRWSFLSPLQHLEQRDELSGSWTLLVSDILFLCLTPPLFTAFLQQQDSRQGSISKAMPNLLEVTVTSAGATRIQRNSLELHLISQITTHRHLH